MDHSLWAEFVHRYRPRLLARLQAQGTEETEAEDAVQEALLSLLDSQDAVKAEKLMPRHEPKLAAWLTLIARHHLLDQYNRNSRLLSLEALPPNLCLANEEWTETVEFGLVLEQVWKKLSFHDQRLLSLKADGHSCKQMARRYGLDVSIIEKRLQRARIRFAHHLHTTISVTCCSCPVFASGIPVTEPSPVGNCSSYTAGLKSPHVLAALWQQKAMIPCVVFHFISIMSQRAGSVRAVHCGCAACRC